MAEEIKEGFRWGRFLSTVTLFITVIVLFTFGAFYLYGLIIDKQVEKISVMVVVILFALPAFIVVGFFYMVASSSNQDKMREFFGNVTKMAGDLKSGITGVSMSGNNQITVTGATLPQNITTTTSTVLPIGATNPTGTQTIQH